MKSFLDMKLDDIPDFISKAPWQQKRDGRQVDPNNHYLVNDYGTTVLITDETKEAMACFESIKDSREKCVIHVVNGHQKVLVSNAPLIHGMFVPRKAANAR